MKRFGRRCAALALAAALIGSLAQPALASYALGSELTGETTELGTGTTLTSQSLWSASKSDLRTEHYVTYTPNTTVKPVVFSGTYVASTNTVSAAAAQLEEQGLRVAAALNGGFFNGDGTAVGMLMTEGVLRSLDVENYAMLGFTNGGQVFIDESRPAMSAAWTAMVTQPAVEPGMWPVTTVEPRAFPVSGFNAYRNANYLGGLYLYNKDFSSRVTSGGPCVSAILRPLGEDGMKMEGALNFQVASVADCTQEGAEFDGVIPESCYMLYAEDHNNPELLDALRNLPVGGQVTISVSGASAQWAEAAYGISGLYALLRDGQIVDGLPTSANPYTAVGLRPDGSAIFYTIDGRQSGYSIGATYAQVAERLQELGCVSAVALDGGGSTTLGATLPGSDSFRLVNRPSTEGRRINNTIALVCPVGTEMFQPGAYVTAQDRVVLAGGSVPVSATAYDSTGRPTGEQPLGWTAEGGAVTVGEDGEAVYTAGAMPGAYTVSAAPGGGGASLRVVDQLTGLTVTRGDSAARVTTLNLEPGDEVDLTVSGAWWNLPVAMDREHISWAVDAAIGTVDPEGHFVAGPRNAEGEITVTAGGVTVTIPVKIDSGCPFTDIAGHWSESYVVQMYKLGLTTGYSREDGTAAYLPGGQLTRAELLAFVTRLLGVDTLYYEDVELPFADQDSIAEWAMPYVKAMYTLKVLRGSEGSDGRLYADANSYVTREETMTILGRILMSSQPADLSQFPDGGAVSDWAAPHVKTLVALGVVGGSNGMLNPRDNIDRAAIAKLLVEVYPLDKALLVPRLDLMM